MSEQWEARVIFRPDMLRSAVYLFQTVGDKRQYVLMNGDYLWADRHVATKDDPIFAWLDESQLHALGVAISKSGYKAPDEHLLEGKLTATERHLEDMRSLVFKARQPKTPDQTK